MWKFRCISKCVEADGLECCPPISKFRKGSGRILDTTVLLFASKMQVAEHRNSEVANRQSRWSALNATYFIGSPTTGANGWAICIHSRFVFSPSSFFSKLKVCEREFGQYCCVLIFDVLSTNHSRPQPSRCYRIAIPPFTESEACHDRQRSCSPMEADLFGLRDCSLRRITPSQQHSPK